MRSYFAGFLLSVCAASASAYAAPGIDDILAANRAASGGDACAGKSALQTDYDFSGQGLTGKTHSLSDLTAERWVDSFDVGPASGANGFDGTDTWEKDTSGTVKLEKGGDERALAVNEGYRRAQLWWGKDRGGAAIVSDGEKTDGGRTFDVLTVTPAGGKRFDAWFDARTHLLSRIVEVQGSLTSTTTLSNYRAVDGCELPGRQIVDTGQGAKYLQTLSLTAATFVAEPPADAFAPPKAAVADYSIARGAEETTVPFRLYNNHIYADVAVNGRGPLMFVFDTGGRNLLTPPEVAALGLPSVGEMPGGGAGEGTVNVGLTKVHALQIGEATVANQLFAVISFLPREVEGIDEKGMVGFETFRRFVTRIDYGANTISLIDPKSFDPADAGTPIPFVFNGDLPEVDGSFEGVPAKFDVDTGSRVELTLTKPFVEAHGLKAKHPRGIDTVDGWGVGGPTRAWVTRGATLTVGPVEVPDVITSFATQSKGAFSAASYDGNIGTGFLKRFVVTFDYGHSVLYLKRLATPAPDTGTYDRSGMWINDSAAGFRIDFVTPHTPAEEAGFRPGDEIVAVDGKPAHAVALYDLRRMLRDDAPGTVVRLTVRRGGGNRNIPLLLRDLV